MAACRGLASAQFFDDGRPAARLAGFFSCPHRAMMKASCSAIVEKLVDQVKAIPREQFDEFLAWLAEYELRQPDDWDQQMERDSAPGGRLQNAIDRAPMTS